MLINYRICEYRVNLLDPYSSRYKYAIIAATDDAVVCIGSNLTDLGVTPENITPGNVIEERVYDNTFTLALNRLQPLCTQTTTGFDILEVYPVGPTNLSFSAIRSYNAPITSLEGLPDKTLLDVIKELCIEEGIPVKYEFEYLIDMITVRTVREMLIVEKRGLPTITEPMEIENSLMMKAAELALQAAGYNLDRNTLYMDSDLMVGRFYRNAI